MLGVSSLKSLISSVTDVIMSDGTIVCDPTNKQSRKSEATLVFVFSSREAEDGSASIVSCYTEGRVSQTKLQECISAAHIDSKEIFIFFAECTNMALILSYNPSYFSIEDILPTQERVPFQVESDLKNLGFLDPGSDNQDQGRGTKLELPLWMVEGLTDNKARNYVTVDVPKTFKEVFREIMSADPLVVDLHKMGPYYYKFARHHMKL